MSFLPILRKSKIGQFRGYFPSMINKDLFLQLFFNGALRKSTGTREIDFLQKVPIGMTLSLSEKIPIGISQNPRTGEFELSENIPIGFPSVLNTAFQRIIPIEISLCTGDLKFKRNNPIGVFPLYWTLWV